VPIASTGQGWLRIPPWAVSALVLCLYILACCTPAAMLPNFYRGGRPLIVERILGFGLLALGWLPSPMILPWLANAFLLVGLILLWRGRFKSALISGCLAAILGFTTWFFIDPGQDAACLHDVMIGYFLWQASLLVFALGTGLIAWQQRNSRVCIQSPFQLSKADPAVAATDQRALDPGPAARY
jgi:hypothetical protein